jgi:hypothetical protein
MTTIDRAALTTCRAIFQPRHLLASLPIGLRIASLAPYTVCAFWIGASEPTSNGLPRQWAPGDSVTLTLRNHNSATPTGAFQWLHDDRPIPDATSDSLTLSNLASPNSGNYRLSITPPNSTPILSDDTVTINVLPLPPEPVDTSFTSELPRDLHIASDIPHTSSAIFAADGSMAFTTVSLGRDFETTAQWAIRLNRNGGLVSAFKFPSTWGSILAGFPAGSLIISTPPYRLNADGSSGTFLLPPPFDSKWGLSAAIVQPDGKFYLAQGKTLARFFADGRIDPSFAFAEPSEAAIEGLKLDRSNRLYVNGIKDNPLPGNWPYNWRTFYRLTANGTRDPNFLTQVAEPILSGGLTVTPMDDGRILYYAYYHGYLTWKMLRDDGTADPAWSGTTNTVWPLTINPATGQVYIIAGSTLYRATITATGIAEDTRFYPGTMLAGGVDLDPTVSSVTLDPSGSLMVFGSFSQWEGHATNGAVRLFTDKPIPNLPPNAFIYADTDQPAKGATLTFNLIVTGTGPFTYQWLALDGQPLPADITSPQLTVPNFTGADLGRYQLRVTGPGGVSVLSNVVSAFPNVGSPYLTNLSGRATVGTGEETAIAGLSTQSTAGSGGVSTLLRGAGPALKAFGVTHFLPDPALDVFTSAGPLIANNDQWSVNPETAAAATTVGAFGFAPNSNDAALLHVFPTGRSTVVLKNWGEGVGPGVGLLEIYQLFQYGNEYSYQSLTNLSFRARTSPGEGTAIAGFVIVDPQNFDRPAKVLLRAIGPTLGSYGIQHPLTNPVLTVYNSKGEVVATDDDWAVNNSSADTATLTAAMKQVGAFDLTADSKDSALLLNLPAGAYSMQATGGSGVVLLEIYLVK